MAVLFYEGKYSILDNFSALQVVYKGILYPTSEHAYQAAKFSHRPDIQGEIRLATSPHTAKEIAYQYKKEYHQDFRTIKLDIMREILKAKMQQHLQVVEALTDSKDELIGENSPVDYFWGLGENGTGENWMGKLWMELREKILNTA